MRVARSWIGFDLPSTAQRSRLAAIGVGNVRWRLTISARLRSSWRQPTTRRLRGTAFTVESIERSVGKTPTMRLNAAQRSRREAEGGVVRARHAHHELRDIARPREPLGLGAVMADPALVAVRALENVVAGVRPFDVVVERGVTGLTRRTFIADGTHGHVGASSMEASIL